MSGRIIDRIFVLVSGMNLFTSLVFYLLLTTMSVYAIQRFAASDALAGFIATSFILGALFSRFVATPLMRLCGRKPLIVTGTLVSCVLVLAYPLIDTVWLLVTVRMLHGFCFGLINMLLTSGMLERTPRSHRAQVAGYLGLPPSLSTALAPLLGVSLLGWWGMEGVFAAAMVFTFFAALPAFFITIPSGKVARFTHPPAQSGVAPAIPKVPKKQLVLLGAVLFLFGFGYAGVMAYLLPYAEEVGAPWSVGVHFTLYTVVAFAGRLLVGRVQDTRGDNAVIYPMLISFACGLALLGLVPSGISIAFAGVLVGFGFGMMMPTVQAAASRLVHDHHLSTAIAVVYVSLDLGIGLAPLVIGVAVAQLGFSGMYLVLSALVVVAGVVYALGHGRARGRNR